MQQPPPMMNMMPPFPPNSITTEQIQKYLDENKTLILAILDNQNLGKLTECAQYQAQLQKNLMYLAAIADAQPPAPTMPSQMPPHPAMQQGGHYMQHPQLVASQQPGGFLPKSPLQFTPQQMQEQQRQQLQHQQTLQSHMGIRPGVNNGLQGMHSEGHLGGNSTGVPSTTGGLTGLPDFSRVGAGHGSGPSASAGAGSGAGAGSSNSPLDTREGKQDGAEAGIGEGQANSGGNNNANSELSQKKGSEDGK